MAHELSIRANGLAEMAFVGETPWHGLGQSLTKGASIGVWQREAGMDWSALAAKPYYHCEQDRHMGGMREVSDSKVLYRSDTGAPLAIVGDNYQVVQPGDVLEFFRDLTEVGGWWIHTAGVLRGGRKVWAMATNGDTANVGKGDKIVRNLLLATSLDGSMRTVADETAVRVVCANTLAMAVGSNGRKAAIQISHRTEFDPAYVKRALGVQADTFKLFMEQAKELADTPIKIDEARHILATIMKVKEAEERRPKLDWLGSLSALGQVPQEPPESRGMARILALFEGEGKGSTLGSARGSKWGLLNAVTEYVDHEMGRTDDTRLDSAWFGRGGNLKQQALAALTA